MSPEAEEELMVLRAIYGEENCHVTLPNKVVLEQRLGGHESEGWVVTLQATLPEGYPTDSLPEVKVHNIEKRGGGGGVGHGRSGSSTSTGTSTTSIAITSSALRNLNEALSLEVTQWQGTAWLHQAMAWILDNASQWLPPPPTSMNPSPSPPTLSSTTTPTTRTVIKLDHMRKHKDYCRLLQCWAEELGLRGMIAMLQASKHVYIMLEGPSSSTSQWLTRLRTEKVDVDSKGRPCRERMSTVVASQTLQPPHNGGEPLLVPAEGGGVLPVRQDWSTERDVLEYIHTTWGMNLLT